MSAEAIIIALIIGGIAGWLAGVIVKGAGFGIVGNIIIGILGAFVASWLFPRLGVALGTDNAILISIIHATIGGVIILLVLSLIRRAA
ncbi:MAG: GlsB/YeaQ/YmgE family stress response membrane protein [Micropepsaceae bacterium]